MAQFMVKIEQHLKLWPIFQKLPIQKKRFYRDVKGSKSIFISRGHSIGELNIKMVFPNKRIKELFYIELQSNPSVNVDLLRLKVYHD